MVVFCVLTLLGILSFFIPRKSMKCFFCAAGIVISVLFFFYSPPESDDLARYYALFDTVKQLNILEFITGNYGTDDWLINYMLNDYKANAGMFAAALFILSRIGIREMMVFIFSVLTYIPLFMLIWEVCEDEQCPKEVFSVCFIVVLACVDVRLVSCLRNLSAFAMFIYVLYKDLVKGANTWFCFVAYMLLCMLHMACVILLVMRTIVFLKNTYLKRLVVAALIFTQALSALVAGVLTTVLKNVPYAIRLAQKIEDYFIKRVNYNIKGSLFFIGVIFAAIFIYIIVNKRKILPSKYSRYEQLFALASAFSVGCLGQYDMLMRNSALIVMLILPFVAVLLNEQLVFRNRTVKLKSSSRREEIGNVASITALIGLIVMSAMFYTLFSYLPMDSCF